MPLHSAQICSAVALQTSDTPGTFRSPYESVYKAFKHFKLNNKVFKLKIKMETKAKIIIGDSRQMKEVKNEETDLIITSPPYWHIKDYGIPGQIGYGQTLHEYLKDLYYVW